MPKIFSAYERSSLCEAGRSPESNAFLTDIMNTDPKQTNRNARKSETPSYKYSFWFNEEHIRFKKLLCKSGLEHNRSQFIVKRIFGEEFVVIKRDPSKTQFIARLNDLKPDIVWWPVYTDYSASEWNRTAKLEYAKQAGKLNVPVLYVNSVCLDQADACGAARGGAALFENGFIKEELPAGQEGILIVEA